MIRKLLFFSSSLFFILIFSRITTETLFKKEILSLPQVDSVEILEFTYFPCVISDFDIVLVLKNGNKIHFEKLNSNLSFTGRTNIQSINDFIFFHHYDGNQAFGLPLFLFEQIYEKTVNNLPLFLIEYTDICRFIFYMKNEDVYFDKSNKKFSINCNAFGNMKFLKETISEKT